MNRGAYASSKPFALIAPWGINALGHQLLHMEDAKRRKALTRKIEWQYLSQIEVQALGFPNPLSSPSHVWAEALYSRQTIH